MTISTKKVSQLKFLFTLNGSLLVRIYVDSPTIAENDICGDELLDGKYSSSFLKKNFCLIKNVLIFEKYQIGSNLLFKSFFLSLIKYLKIILDYKL